MTPITGRIGHYGNRFRYRGQRVYYEKTEHISLFWFWSVLLSCWLALTIHFLINIQELPHPNPSSEPRLTSVYLFVWIFISTIIGIGFSISYSKLRENETNMRSEEEKKDLLDRIKPSKRTNL
jgi:hypothetical protein